MPPTFCTTRYWKHRKNSSKPPGIKNQPVMQPPYLSFNKDDNYFLLLLLTRKNSGDISATPIEQQDKIKKALESLANSKNIIRSLTPLIYQAARKEGLYSELPQSCQSLIKKSYINTLAAEMLSKQWLDKILNILNKNNIPVILLKSAAFSGTLYSAEAPRPGRDIDILVSKTNFEKSCTLLSEHMTELVIKQTRQATHNTLFERVFQTKNGNGPIIEIHKGLTNPYIFTIIETELWKQSKIHPSYSNKLVRILSPEHTLLHLAVHAFRDLDFCTHNLIDAHETIRQWQPKKDILINQAGKWGAKNVLYCLLRNCEAVLETPLPDNLLSELRPSKMVDKLNKKILLSITKQDSVAKNKRFRLQQLLSQFVFPDKFINSLHFQFDYTKTRIKDLFPGYKRQVK